MLFAFPSVVCVCANAVGKGTFTYVDPSGYVPDWDQKWDNEARAALLGPAAASASDELAYNPTAKLAITDAQHVVESAINAQNRGTNPAEPKDYLSALMKRLNYNLKNTDGGRYNFDWEKGAETPTIRSADGSFRIYVSAKNFGPRPELRNSIRLDVVLGRQSRTEYRFFNRGGTFWRGYKNVELPEIPFGLSAREPGSD